MYLELLWPDDVSLFPNTEKTRLPSALRKRQREPCVVAYSVGHYSCICLLHVRKH